MYMTAILVKFPRLSFQEECIYVLCLLFLLQRAVWLKRTGSGGRLATIYVDSNFEGLAVRQFDSVN
jgi:hypothetical protein